jgi:NAD(P)-dependent dehydrogenase (short-subunit alcohol dehydrogenase family)
MRAFADSRATLDSVTWGRSQPLAVEARMHVKLKPLSQQTIVVTGATSGIGLATVRAAVERGARVAAIARNEDMLRDLVNELTAKGREAMYVACDVADEQALRDAARRIAEHFGRIDTWVNNAGVSVYAKLEDTPLEDAKRLFDTNLWGVVNGSRAALPYLASNGGALINVGSELSGSPLPLQGIYAASKHAVAAYTDSLRIELLEARKPVSVTLIRPTAIDTPYVEHAKKRLDVMPKLPPPLFAPEVVADAILFAAEHQRRDIYVGGKAKLSTVLAQRWPSVSDSMLSRFGSRMQRTDHPLDGPDDGGLYQSRSALMVRGQPQGRVLSRSLYTKAAEHRGTVALAVVGIAAAALVAALLPRRSGPLGMLRGATLSGALPARSLANHASSLVPSRSLARRLPRAAAAALHHAIAPRRRTLARLRPSWL